ncbi:hypothetical protein [Laspinema olomoucense]|nr:MULTISPECIES: hypothetical protein [unclassified Laspinema]
MPNFRKNNRNRDNSAGIPDAYLTDFYELSLEEKGPGLVNLPEPE